MAYDTAKPQCSKLEKRPGCIQAALAVLGDKWTPLLLGQLVSGEKTFGELESMLTGISPRTLSARLDKLLEEKIVTKNQYNEHPPRYKYDLTKKGQGLQEVLQQMADWGEKYHD
jgi:DNA-binding HxlR family transcriptional regulator